MDTVLYQNYERKNLLNFLIRAGLVFFKPCPPPPQTKFFNFKTRPIFIGAPKCIFFGGGGPNTVWPFDIQNRVDIKSLILSNYRKYHFTMDALKLHDKFSSYEELQSKVDLYQKTKYLCLSKRTSRTIDAAIKQKSLSQDSISAEKRTSLKYYMIKYTCIHGGRAYRNRSTGKRSSSTFWRIVLFKWLSTYRVIATFWR